MLGRLVFTAVFINQILKRPLDVRT